MGMNEMFEMLVTRGISNFEYPRVRVAVTRARPETGRDARFRVIPTRVTHFSVTQFDCEPLSRRILT